MISINLKNNLVWKEIATRIAFVVVTMGLIVWLMPRDRQTEDYKFEKGKVWNYPDLTATFNFNVYKSNADIEKEQQQIIKNYKPYYLYDNKVQANMLEKFKDEKGLTAYIFAFNYMQLVKDKLDSVYANGIIDTREPLKEASDTIRRISADNKTHADNLPAKRVLTAKEAYEVIINSPNLKPYRDVIIGLDLNEYIVPNLIYDNAFNESERSSLLQSVATSFGQVQAGENIIRNGQKIDEITYQKLASYFQQLEKIKVKKRVPMNILGEVIYVLILIVGFTIYLGIYRKDYFENIRSAGMIYVLICIFSIFSSLLVSHSFLHVLILPFAVVPVYIRIFMDSRTAFMAHTTVVLICACILHYPLEFITVELVMGITAIYMLRELSSRSQLFWTAAVTTLVGMLMHLAVYMIRHQDMASLNMWDFYYLIISGFLLFCSYPLVYLIEKTFGFLSEITLIELSDTNKELLRNMSEVAPGTFQHSIMVGNLAAEVARKINANAQLLRTGALYHDIGKTQNPIYFTENQAGGISPHDHLNYMESAQMIISHVTEGIRLANKYHLPNQIRDLIATHHGQGKAKYFYIKYMNEHPDEKIDDLLFTYPGPNPFTKEQAILMMADAVEAASRSLPEYSETTIRSLVDRIIDGQVNEGFFRECPITFRDIQYAKTVLIEKLKTIYHTRISYPEARK